ncbi:ppx-GppA phosphatase isoform X2 [Tasmannia lanceolata]|uniref:ppx-GppA phosphatase isoform X2 n=1 Tax=Tasmannia lanceolata TaxID=3420 RepID=UPI004064B348
MSIDIPTNSLNTPKLLAAIDMGTNSFKMLLIRADPRGRFLTVDRFKEPVVLGRDMISTVNPSANSPPSISIDSQRRAISALQNFSGILHGHHVNKTAIVATSAVREAKNQREFLSRVRDELGFEINVLSGEEEARFVYLGVLQFLPLYDKTILTVDIGGGSTEFVLGKEGKVIFAVSLKLGHVSLTESFVKNGKIVEMQQYIRSVVIKSDLVEKVREIGFDVAVGSSGTIRSIEKAVFLGFGFDRANEGVAFGEFSREWKFSREELIGVVEGLCGLDGEGELERRVGFFKRRAEFILAGGVLLREIFEILDIGEMEVSGYALGEGVVSEMLRKDCEGYDVGVNVRWRSVVRLATRFNGEKRMKLAVQCVGIAKEFFEGLEKCNELTNHQSSSAVCLGEKDLEYLDAAILLHNIGLFFGKKGYHKQSYHIIKNGHHLYGYNAEEVELIALLARYHRKKFPRYGHASLQGLTEEVKLKFRVLCVVMRISLVLCMRFQGLEISLSHEGYKLVITELKGRSLLPDSVQPTLVDIMKELKPELEHFKEVFNQNLSVVILS